MFRIWDHQYSHGFFFVCCFGSGISSEDLGSFAQFAELFRGAEAQMGILFTKSENYDDEKKKQDIVDQLTQHPEFEQFINLVGSRIYFTGAIDPDVHKRANNDTIQTMTENVLIMRRFLYESVMDIETPVHIRSLDFYTNQENVINELVDDIRRIKESLEIQGDNINVHEELQKKNWNNFPNLNTLPSTQLD